MKHYFSRMKSKGRCPPRKPVSKIVWSWVGAFLGILVISVLHRHVIGGASPFLIGSFGATAVLIYGAPMAEYSQPRNLVGGHVFSAIVGVTVVLTMGADCLLSAPLAVSLAVAAMHGTRTMHPPGGATALIAVIGGEDIHRLGYAYVVMPILAGAMAMLLLALTINNLSANPRRHYPVYWF